MSRIDIDPESLDGSGQELEATAMRFFTALEQFSGRIEGTEDAAGGDEIGGSIGTAHQEVYTKAMECFQEGALSIQEAGLDLRQFAADHLAADGDIAQLFTRLEKHLGGDA